MALNKESTVTFVPAVYRADAQSSADLASLTGAIKNQSQTFYNPTLSQPTIDPKQVFTAKRASTIEKQSESPIGASTVQSFP